MFDLSIIILNFNTKELTLDCIRGIEANTHDINYDIWIVDNNSSDESLEAIRNLKNKYKNLNVIENKENYGFAKGNNIALKKIYKSSEYCLLLNSDTKVNANFKELVEYARQKKYDIVSCKIVDSRGNFQPNGGHIPTPSTVFFWLTGLDDLLRTIFPIHSYQERRADYFKNAEKVGWVSGTVMLINSQVLKRIGFFDENLFMYSEDVDFCWRANEKGFKIGWTDFLTITHLGGGSSEKPRESQWLGEFRGLLYLYKKHYGRVAKYIFKLSMYLFIGLRSLAFLIVGKVEYAKTYAKIITKI